MSDTQPLYDLAPVLELMLLGLLIALGPLAWVWARNRRSSPMRRLQALTVLTLFLTFDLVLFGAFTRLTDSGLGCPDWPGCYGSASPVGARAEIAAAQEAMPTGPVTHGKAWVEMIHRYLATGVGVLIIVLALATWLQWRRARAAVGESAAPVHPGWPLFTLAWYCCSSKAEAAAASKAAPKAPARKKAAAAVDAVEAPAKASPARKAAAKPKATAPEAAAVKKAPARPSLRV